MCRILSLLTVLTTYSAIYGQNLLVNGSFQDPLGAKATVTISGNVSDGDTIEIDTSGVNRVYEFDTGDGIDPGSDVAVNVSGGMDKKNARRELKTAINADAAAPCNADTTIPGDTVLLTWRVTGGVGATNTNNTDANNSINVTSFVDPGCLQDFEPVPAWPAWEGTARRNGDIYVPTCPRGGDGVHASLQYWGSSAVSIYQTVDGLTAGTAYTLQGVWWIGHGTTDGENTATAELHDGSDPTAPLIAGAEVVVDYDGDTGEWLPFLVHGAPTGTSMTVVLRTSNTGPMGYAMHVDDCVLEEGALCPNPPSIDSILPAYGVQGNPSAGVTIGGSNYVGDSTTVKLKKVGAADEIPGDNVQVAGDGKSLTCSFDLTAAAQGRWNVEVTVTGENCPPATLPSKFVVVLPAFSNGSFEDPDPGNAGCSAATENGAPRDWLRLQVAEYGWDDLLYRDEIDDYPPTCGNPFPDGGYHYASSWSADDGHAGAEGRIFQTFAADAGKEYTISGYFAGGGNNTVTLSLLDGDEDASSLATTTISTGGTYDWMFAFAHGAPTGGLLTAEWKIRLTGAGPHAAHADNLSIAVCVDPITVTGVNPARGVNDGTASVTVTGTGFTGAPSVALMGAGAAILATVNGVSGTEISCDFDLAGATSGYYDLVVQQEGCVARLPGEFLVLGKGLTNGDFEEPLVGLDCGKLTIGASGWNYTDDWWREHNRWQPTCPRSVPEPVPPEGYGHFQSMTTATGKLERAWQIISVTPGSYYRFSGWFAGGGTNTVKIRLMEGADPDPGTLNEIASTTAYTCGSGCSTYNWTYAEVVGGTPGDVMTVIWEMTDASDSSATHADGLTFEPACHDPFADADVDSDVDQADFAILQLCVTGTDNPPIPGNPSYCMCFNRDFDNDVDPTDVHLFEACSSGPAVPADACCDGGDGCP